MDGGTTVKPSSSPAIHMHNGTLCETLRCRMYNCAARAFSWTSFYGHKMQREIIWSAHRTKWKMRMDTHSVCYYRAQPLWTFNVHCMHALARCSFALHGIMYRFWNENSHIVNVFSCSSFGLAISSPTQQAAQLAVECPLFNQAVRSFAHQVVSDAGHCSANARHSRLFPFHFPLFSLRLHAYYSNKYENASDCEWMREKMAESLFPLIAATFYCHYVACDCYCPLNKF